MYLGRARSYWSKRRTWCARRRWRCCKYWRNSPRPVVPSNSLLFSLNFSSAVNRPFMAGKAKNMCQRCTLLGGGGQWSEGHGPPLLGNFGVKFSETSFPHFRTYFYANQPLLSFRQPFKMFDSNNFTLSSMFSFQNAWPIKRKAVYTFSLVHFHILIHFPVRIGSDHNLHIFLKQFI